jgi:high-affinity Fe2+/Pb2+ permease
MMDHSHDHASVDGPWAGGWAVALVAGLFAAMIARVFGEVGLTAALLVGLVTFAVYGVLLGSGGVEVTVTEDHGAGHDGHGHH